jgi:hypothetical protein
MGRNKLTKSEIIKTHDENIRAAELKEDFETELDKTLKQLVNIYPRHSRANNICCKSKWHNV